MAADGIVAPHRAPPLPCTGPLSRFRKPHRPPVTGQCGKNRGGTPQSHRHSFAAGQGAGRAPTCEPAAPSVASTSPSPSTPATPPPPRRTASPLHPPGTRRHRSACNFQLCKVIGNHCTLSAMQVAVPVCNMLVASSLCTPCHCPLHPFQL
jgi:hypothetical protein